MNTFKIEDVYSADEIFVTETFAGVIPELRELNHRKMIGEKFHNIW
jgi:branched-subunit amino acid aminotransferase/4-amino-4-deoxychorismate lyase